jgi:hypothetical protein
MRFSTGSGLACLQRLFVWMFLALGLAGLGMFFWWMLGL